MGFFLWILVKILNKRYQNIPKLLLNYLLNLI